MAKRHLKQCSTSLTVQFSSAAQSCPTLCNPMNCSTPGLPVHHQLPELTQTHVHWVGDAIQPSHPLSSPSPPAPNPSQHQSLFQWVKRNANQNYSKVIVITSLVAQLVKNLPAMQETWVRSLGCEDPLGKEKATHYSILTWKILYCVVHGVTKSWTLLSDFHFTSFSPPHSSQNGHHQNIYNQSMLGRMWKKGNPPTLWKCKLVQPLCRTV